VQRIFNRDISPLLIELFKQTNARISRNEGLDIANGLRMDRLQTIAAEFERQWPRAIVSTGSSLQQGPGSPGIRTGDGGQISGLQLRRGVV